jgi:hypothetical protein
VPPTTITAVYDLASELLAVAESATALTTAGTPDRSYIAASSPPWDCCPFLTVHVAALSELTTSPLVPAPATGLRTQFGRVTLAQLVVTVVRCAARVPDTGLPSVTDLEAVAAQVQEDGWALWNGLRWAVECETFLDLCSYVFVDRGVAITEQGNCVGWQFSIRAQIEGMENPGCGS